MIALELITQIDRAGGRLSKQGGRLVVDAPPAFLSEAVLLKIKREKDTIFKILELKVLIETVSTAYGGDEQQYLAEYLDDQLASNDIDQALVCFHDLVRQTQIRR